MTESGSQGSDRIPTRSKGLDESLDAKAMEVIVSSGLGNYWLIPSHWLGSKLSRIRQRFLQDPLAGGKIP